MSLFFPPASSPLPPTTNRESKGLPSSQFLETENSWKNFVKEKKRKREGGRRFNIKLTCGTDHIFFPSFQALPEQAIFPRLKLNTIAKGHLLSN